METKLLLVIFHKGLNLDHTNCYRVHILNREKNYSKITPSKFLGQASPEQDKNTHYPKIKMNKSMSFKTKTIKTNSQSNYKVKIYEKEKTRRDEAPWSLRDTMPSSTDTTSTFPPSAMR